MKRVRANQRHISSLRYCWDSKVTRGLMASVTETPEIVLARENAKKFSDVQYREEVGHGTPVMDTPEMERVRRNQENISSVSRTEREISVIIVFTGGKFRLSAEKKRQIKICRNSQREKLFKKI
ncbi:hypothetical protein AMECASPLE_038810 [Ameca splendens]|uniref:Uncharacterized protein n=1 Tax=Ameca splendens TaxID=208324 RepID=A0ABV1A3Q3_9TELE